MNKQIERENMPFSENKVDVKGVSEEIRLYKELGKIISEEDRIMKEINKVFESTADRGEAEKIVLEKWMPLLDKATKKSSELINRWLKEMDESRQEYEKEY